uniref:Uncharacterized protein n=1 Tax=Salix viminalis TaxID=40686 RepID=A0A6N2N6C8_SALVM
MGKDVKGGKRGREKKEGYNSNNNNNKVWYGTHKLIHSIVFLFFFLCFRNTFSAATSSLFDKFSPEFSFL